MQLIIDRRNTHIVSELIEVAALLHYTVPMHLSFGDPLLGKELSCRVRCFSIAFALNAILTNPAHYSRRKQHPHCFRNYRSRCFITLHGSHPSVSRSFDDGRPSP
jgi:hypothetical protein